MRSIIKPPLPRLTLLATLLALATSVAVSVVGTYRSHHSGIPPEAIVLGADSTAWFLGEEHARALVRECRNDDERALRLLDVRARETNIRSRLGNTAANAYVGGFEYGLRAASDSLARVIFD